MKVLRISWDSKWKDVPVNEEEKVLERPRRINITDKTQSLKIRPTNNFKKKKKKANL